MSTIQNTDEKPFVRELAFGETKDNKQRHKFFYL